MVAAPAFVRLNIGWNAEPNVPEPKVLVESTALRLQFSLAAADTAMIGPLAELRFDNCQRWRLGPTNDEGWYMGQCRYSGFAPRWGEFYELVGEDGLRRVPTDWQPMPQAGSGVRHFLFYFRDETFECYASEWSGTGLVFGGKGRYRFVESVFLRLFGFRSRPKI